LRNKDARMSRVEKLGALGAVVGLALLGLFWGGNVGAAIGALVGLVAAVKATSR
jgi:hypothetical protein